jgi:hypothetical protein
LAIVPRAQRFQIPMRVLWRPRGDSEWGEAVSVNASRSGVLFRSNRLLTVGTEIELILALSWETSSSVEAADVICSGRIVRAETGAADGKSALAATIESYEYLREH